MVAEILGLYASRLCSNLLYLRCLQYILSSSPELLATVPVRPQYILLTGTHHDLIREHLLPMCFFIVVLRLRIRDNSKDDRAANGPSVNTDYNYKVSDCSCCTHHYSFTRVAHVAKVPIQCFHQACAQMRAGAFKCKCKCKRRIKCKCKCKCAAVESNASANANAQQLNQMQMQMHLDQMQMNLDQIQIHLDRMKMEFYVCTDLPEAYSRRNQLTK